MYEYKYNELKSLDDNLLNFNYLNVISRCLKKTIFRVMNGFAKSNFGPTH